VRGLPTYGVSGRSNSLGVLRKRAAGGGDSSLLNDLVAYWKLDETSGTRFDSAGTNNLADNNTVGSAIGKQGNAASFGPGRDEYLSYPSPVIQTTTFSVSAWVSLKSFTAFGRAIFYQGNLANDAGLHLFAINTWEGETNCLGFRYNGAGNSPSNSNVITLNTWHHVVVTYDGSEVNFYVDNVAAGSNTIDISASPSPDPFYMGVWFALDADRIWDGDIDELGIWSRVLTSGEITQLYNGGAGITYPFV
jgi:hypothetical protein